MSRKNTSQRVSGSKKKKLHNDGSDEISLDRNIDLCMDTDFQVVKDSQTPLEGHIDLFGELIPPDECVSNEEAKNKSTKKTPVSKKKKQPYEELFFGTPAIRPKRLFIPTMKFMKIMKEAQTELYSLMGVRTSSSKVSVVSTDSLNISGVQHLQDSPQISISNESKINTENNDNDKKSQQVLEGVIAFVDYKIDNDRSDTSIKERLIELGAKVEKTFNRKVTHVMFCDGYRSTYNKAVERNIPLVSARWMKYSQLANKIQDPADYPPVGMEKYTKTPSRKINIPDDFHKSIDAAQILSNKLRKELNNVVSPVPDEKVISKLLFSSDKDLNNIEVDDFPTQTNDSDSRIMSLNSMINQTPKVSLADDDVVLQSIACTGMIKSEVKILKASIQNLGKFIFHTNVKPTTTYLITKSQSNQSLDIVFAMAYGCFIVTEDWVHKSYSIGRWLSHQQYLISDLPEPVKDFQIRRHTTFGLALKFNIFNNAGKIYISDSCESPAKLLRRLVHACGGHCTSTESVAKVVIGYTLQMNNNIHEKWILDCITQGTLLNKCQYNLVNFNE